MTYRNRHPPSTEHLIRSDWFLAILLIERLPKYEVTPENVAACKSLAARFVIEREADIERAIEVMNGTFSDPDLEDLAAAVLVGLVPWARGEMPRVGFMDRVPGLTERVGHRLPIKRQDRHRLDAT